MMSEVKLSERVKLWEFHWINLRRTQCLMVLDAANDIAELESKCDTLATENAALRAERERLTAKCEEQAKDLLALQRLVKENIFGQGKPHKPEKENEGRS